MQKYTGPQIFIRGFLYIAVAIGNETISVLSGGPIDVRVAGWKIAIAGVINLRAYLDKTPAENVKDADVDFSKISKSIVTPPADK